MLVKRQLALILETIKKVITEVGSEDHVDEVRSAAVELKNSVFLVIFCLPFCFCLYFCLL